MNQPLVSVIIPCYNTAAYLTETLESLFAQSFDHFEAIAIDDGSSDDTLEILQRFAAIDKRLTVLSQANTYCVIARTNAIARAKGKYLVCLDSDDKLAVDYLKKCVAIAESDEQLSVVYSKAMLFDRENKAWPLPEFHTKDFLLSNCIFITALIRKSHYDAVGGFDTGLTMFEDWDLFISLVENHGKIHRINEPLFFYRQRQTCSSVTNQASKQKWSDNLFKIYQKHYAFYCSNGLYFHDLMAARLKREQYYQKPWRKWFYKHFKPQKYKILCDKSHCG